MTETGTIQIKIGEVEVTCTGSIDRERLEDVLGCLRSQLPELVDSGTRPTPPSVAEMLAHSDARTFGEKAGVIAYWLEEHGGRRDWRSGDIVSALREAGERPPANITDTLNQKRDKGLFEVQDRRWSLTGEGRGWVKYRLLNRGSEE